MQGPVYGVHANDFSKEHKLEPTFAYDDMFGTVLNRFIVQAVNNYPLTVYGSGGQTRAFIHITDTAKCISLAIKNSNFKNNRVRIFNQVSEVHRVIDLAKMISKQFSINIDFLKNPRKELSKNDLDVKNNNFKEMGFIPELLEKKLIDDFKYLVNQNKKNFNKLKITNSPEW